MISDDEASDACAGKSSPARDGLTLEEQTAFLKSIEAIRHRGHGYLKTCHDAGDAIKLIGDLHRAVDTVFQQGGQGACKPECKAGCSYCCHLRVEIIDAEAFFIAEEVQRWPPAELAALIERLRLHVAANGSESSGIRASSACAFLRDGLCSIYKVRPAACRKAHSLSAEQCRLAARQLPQNLQVVAEAEALMLGISAAYRAAGLPSESLELCAAVLRALTDATAKLKWYAGASVF